MTKLSGWLRYWYITIILPKPPVSAILLVSATYVILRKITSAIRDQSENREHKFTLRKHEDRHLVYLICGNDIKFPRARTTHCRSTTLKRRGRTGWKLGWHGHVWTD